MKLLSRLSPCYLVLLFLFGLLYVGCDFADQPAVPASETAFQGIVGGEPEEGWEPVGALTRVATAYGYFGSFCSGTLIAPHWVLTAAHCVSSSPENPVLPETTYFFIGPDSNPPWYGLFPPDGKTFQADKFFIHPQYSTVYGDNDIALVHLADPVEDIEPVAYFSGSMDKSFLSQEILYVGYGVSNGINNSGGGIKRTGTMVLYHYDKTYYVSGFKQSGVCFGDSGGPGLFEIDGKWQIIGINSSVFSNNPDPCTGGAIQTRVDTYADWIQDTLDADTADCRVDADICFCPQACNPYGGCDNEQCKIYTCDDVLKCFKDCDHEPACQARCYIRIMPDALELLHNYYWCRMQECYNSNDPDSCADQHCSKYREQCQDTPVGTDTCTDMHTCVAMCDWTEPSCFSDCYFQGSTDAQNKYVEMWDCFEKSCSTTPLFNFEKDCGWQHCAYELEVCVEPDFCSMLGGDCSFGNACWFTPTNKPHCFTSDNIQEGAACPQIPLHTRPCADGMQCVMVGGNARCHRVCLHNSHCRTGEICEESAIDGLPEYGYCICQDDDQDGHCSLDDCDDNNPDIHPDKGERCWDEIDNNCNGETDEGCLSEDDTDGAKGSIPATNENSGCQTGRSAGTTIPLLLILLAMLAILPRKSTDPTQT